MSLRHFWIRTSILLATTLTVRSARGTEPVPLPSIFDAMTARPLGPASMGGRVTSLAVAESRPTTIYVGTASGGLWKTVNNGTTWKPVLDAAGVASVGDVAVAPSDPDVVWVGTGEANPRNSVSWGNGVYRSTDGGRTWQHRGLRDTAHIGRLLVHPGSPEVAYVAALGHVWAASRLRGLFKTTDGGESWQNIFYLDDDTGAIDLAMDPSDPETLYVAAWQCRRDRFSGGNPAFQTGPGSALYKTTDGGRTWLRLWAGLPERPLGRCGLSISRRDPRIVYAVVATDLTDASNVGQLPRTGRDPARGGIFRSDDGGLNWTKLNDLCPRPFYYGQIRTDPRDERRLYVLGRDLYVSDDGGRTFRDSGAPLTHVDHHALWIDPRDPGHLILAGDGGLYFSYDRGATWQNIDQLPIAQFYSVAVDDRRPYRVYGGIQDNGTWGGPSATHRPEGITTADWFTVLGGDGFRCQVDPADHDTVYAQTQYGGLHRISVRTGADQSIRPRPSPGAPAFRFNWDAPLVISPHDPRTLFYGGDSLFRSTDRGEHWTTISPNLTGGRPGPSPDSGHTLTAIAQSPRQAELLYAGTDDGRLWLSRDAGRQWTELNKRLAGVPADGWVTWLECSRFAEQTAYVTVDRHRLDDRTPYLLRTDDGGQTWRLLTAGLPAGAPVHVVREDPFNRQLLFAGTEQGLFASLDGGARWHRLGGRLPRVPVHDLVIHPRERELVIATHGRGLYVMDVLPLEGLTASVRAEAVHLFDVRPGVPFLYHGSRARYGANVFAAPNPPYGTAIAYYLGKPAPDAVRLEVLNDRGQRVVLLPASGDPGLHRAVWDLKVAVSVGPVQVPVPAPPGEYLVRLHAGPAVQQTKVMVLRGR